MKPDRLAARPAVATENHNRNKFWLDKDGVVDLNNPDFFPLSVNLKNQEINFVWLDPKRMAEANFLSRRKFGADDGSEAIAVSQLDLDRSTHAEMQLNFVVHIAYSLSTLMARCLHEVTDQLVLKEPAALTDLADSQPGLPSTVVRGANRMDEQTWHRTLDIVLSLYRRTHPGHSGVVIKAHDRVSPILDPILECVPNARFVYMYIDPRPFAFSCLGRLARRRWARRNLRRSLVTDVHPDGIPSFRDLTDAQCVVLLWSARMGRLRDFQRRFGNERVMAVNGQNLADAPGQTVAKVADFLGIEVDQDKLDGLAENSIMKVHAKGNGRDFSPEARRQWLIDMEARYGAELGDAVAWARDFVDRYEAAG